jgi:hypothetical protein
MVNITEATKHMLFRNNLQPINVILKKISGIDECEKGLLFIGI